MTKNKDEMKALEKVKRRLWSNGYSAKDVSQFADYDLLVEGAIKVEVREAAYKQTKNGICWYLKNINTLKADILAIVITTPLDDVLVYYRKNTKNFMVLDGDNLKINTKELKELFTDSPKKIFNNLKEV